MGIEPNRSIQNEDGPLEPVEKIGRPFRRRRRRNHSDPFSAPSERAEHPFRLKIHPRLRPVLKRIGIPEPQPFTPDPFQVEALERLEASDVLVTAPTGSGKTFIAVEAIGRVFGAGGKCWYTSPLKALSNSKYEEFSALFGADNVGILTGDRKEKTHAPIIVGTTEILRNQLYDTMHRGEDLEVDLVILDEAHYLGDQDRGVVWEEVLIYLPSRVKVLLLSATIQNAAQICQWLEWLRSAPCSHVAAYERPVPLYPLFLFPSGELTPLGSRKGLFDKIHSIDPRSFPKREFPPITRVMEALKGANLLPAIFFLKSRSDCENAISLCHPASGPRGRQDREAFKARLDELLEEHPFLHAHQHLAILESCRVGAHHGGQLPHWKLLLEQLMQDGFLDAIFSTSTVAAGVNFPARTVVVFQSDRFNGQEFVPLTATDLLQMTGRAGRRGMDEIGFVLVVPGPHQDAELIHALLRSPPDPIESQIRVNFSMVLNLLLSHSPEEIRSLFAASLATYQNLSREGEVARRFADLENELGEWAPEMACGSLEALAEVRPQYWDLKEQIRRKRRQMKRESAPHSAEKILVPGRLFLSPRGTVYVVTANPWMNHETVEAVRLALPLKMKKGHIRTFRVPFHRISELGERLDELPPLRDRSAWEALTAEVNAQPFKIMQMPTEAEKAARIQSAADELSRLKSRKRALPCERCALFGPCQKGTAHPFSTLLQQYSELKSQMSTIQEQLWRSFQKHFLLLQEEGYVDAEGRLTEDGLWASKLRLDQPILISETIRRNLLPDDNPPLLAGLIATFVMDRERQGDVQLASFVYQYPDLAKPFFQMLQGIQPLRNRLQDAGFSIPPLPFWALTTVYYWAKGAAWDQLRNIAGMDEGDLAMVILRAADHLRQVESLADTHPRLATSATEAIRLLLREPVIFD